MADAPSAPVTIPIPPDLAARMEDLKRDREEERDRSLHDIVLEMCRQFVRLRESVRESLADQERINQSYIDHPNDWDDKEIWEKLYAEQMGKQS